MSNATSYKTGVCAQYETLLTECEAALERWDDRRKEVNQLRLHGKEIRGELLHLQANYAKAYAELWKHAQDCEICRFLARTAGHNSDHTINFDSGKKVRV